MLQGISWDSVNEKSNKYYKDVYISGDATEKTIHFYI